MFQGLQSELIYIINHALSEHLLWEEPQLIADKTIEIIETLTIILKF